MLRAEKTWSCDPSPDKKEKRWKNMHINKILY
jgi:hypothetical protein